MALTKIRIGDFVTLIDERNSFDICAFYGININKEFMPTAASTGSLDATNYKVVRKNRFVYSGMQTGRDKCIRLGFYTDDTPIIVSPAYITFEIINTDVIVSENNVELPSDMNGMVYTNKTDWKVDVLKELKAMGFTIDFNKLYEG